MLNWLKTFLTNPNLDEVTRVIGSIAILVIAFLIALATWFAR